MRDNYKNLINSKKTKFRITFSIIVCLSNLRRINFCHINLYPPSFSALLFFGLRHSERPVGLVELVGAVGAVGAVGGYLCNYEWLISEPEEVLCIVL